MNGMMSEGKSAVDTSGAMAPSSVGPSAMPAITSPITRGWRSATAAMPNSRATSITTTIAMKNAAKRLPASRCFTRLSRSLPGGGGWPTAGGSSPGGSSVRLIVRSSASP